MVRATTIKLCIDILSMGCVFGSRYQLLFQLNLPLVKHWPSIETVLVTVAKKHPLSVDNNYQKFYGDEFDFWSFTQNVICNFF